MTKEAQTTIWGLVWAACFLTVCLVISAGPKLTLEVAGDFVDAVRAVVRVVIPWP